MNNDLMFSSKSVIWETPQHFFDRLDAEFHFTLDVAALKENAKCKNYYTPEENGLQKEWNGVVWCNPPYGRKETGLWVKKAYEEHMKGCKTIVMLLPARTDTKWFHEYIYGKAEIRFVKGRLKFGGGERCSAFSEHGGSFQKRKEEIKWIQLKKYWNEIGQKNLTNWRKTE